MNKSIGVRVFNVFNIMMLTAFCIICLYPFLNILAISLNEGSDAARGGISIWPRKFTIVNYQVVFRGSDILYAFLFSSGMTIIRTIVVLLCTAMGAYAFTKKNFPWRSGIITFFLIPMFIGGGLVPYFLVIKTLGLMNNFLVYVLPLVFDFYSAIIMRVYFDHNIHESLSESAYIDGATDFSIFFHIYIPLSKPMLAAIALFIGVAAWNDWYTTLLFCGNTRELWTLQYLLQRLVMQTEQARRMAQLMTQKTGQMIKKNVITPQTITYATMMIATVPIVIVYPFLQKYFIKGMMLGSIKG
jgi:putative aldouronate transport system permease protein